MFDPLETLTFVAANTGKIALGTSVIDMLFHNPVQDHLNILIKDIAKKGGSFSTSQHSIRFKSQSSATTTNEGQRFPFTGTIDQIDNDIKKVKQMDIDNIVFGYALIPIGRDPNKVLDITKQLAKFAR